MALVQAIRRFRSTPQAGVGAVQTGCIETEGEMMRYNRLIILLWRFFKPGL